MSDNNLLNLDELEVNNRQVTLHGQAYQVLTPTVEGSIHLQQLGYAVDEAIKSQATNSSELSQQFFEEIGKLVPGLDVLKLNVDQASKLMAFILNPAANATQASESPQEGSESPKEPQT